MELLQLGQARIMLRIVIISSVELQQSSYTGIVAVGQLLIPNINGIPQRNQKVSQLKMAKRID